MKILKSALIGADPELFVVNQATGKIVPSLDLIGGTKWAPRPSSVEGFFVQEDNVLVEYNIPPASTQEEFRRNILKGLEVFKEFLPENHEVKIATSHLFSPEDLVDPRALEFGCESDRNAWTKEINVFPEIPDNGLRTAGGHVHVGYTFDHDVLKKNEILTDRAEVNAEIVKWMDLFLGVPSMRLDKDTRRRVLYGKAGAYRDKPYGTEYRTLSSFWLGSGELIDWVYQQTQRAVDKVSEMQFLPDNLYGRVSAAIDFNNETELAALSEEYQIQLV